MFSIIALKATSRRSHILPRRLSCSSSKVLPCSFLRAIILPMASPESPRLSSSPIILYIPLMRLEDTSEISPFETSLR